MSRKAELLRENAVAKHVYGSLDLYGLKSLQLSSCAGPSPWIFWVWLPPFTRAVDFTQTFSF